MNKGYRNVWTRFPVLVLLAALLSPLAPAQGQDKDPFKGRLFPPNVIMENRDALNLSKAQFTAIRETVVETQSGIAEHEWDLHEAYQAVISALDKQPVNEDEVMVNVEAVLLAENEVKKRQVGMLLRLRNLLTDEQMEILRSLQ